ncbi:hypothetical protein [Microbacterium sp.]|uniref:hypothetical protein n=1 Tax=Microbacterium sp. TaxID=51671 RepID=UPI0028116EE6|nr:hypothetical protein [Microbacterium sp.]
MGQNMERLGRLKANRGNIVATGTRVAQAAQRTAVVTVVGTASAGVTKAARTEGFEGDLGEVIQTRLKAIHAELERFGKFQSELGAAINAANEALEEASGGIGGLPGTELTPAQKNTIDMAAATGSPVQVTPGTALTPEQAAKWYQEQAEAEQEEAARKLTVALDKRLQEIIDGMPTSEYDPDEPDKDPSDDQDDSNSPTVDDPRTGGGGPGVTGPRTGPGGNGGYDGPGVTDPGRNDPPRVITPVYPDPRDPEVYPPVRPNPNDPDGPNIDGGPDGYVPVRPPVGVTPPVGVMPPGGVIPPGGGLVAPGGVGLVGGVGGVGGAALAGGAARVGGAGLAGGAGRIGGVGGINGAGGTAGGAGGVAGVAQTGAAGGGRGGMLAGGAAGGAGGAGGKKNRRRGQDLLAYELEADEDDVTPDLGEAGAAGRSASDGREELGW